MGNKLAEDKVLLCDANFSSLPLLFAIRDFGHQVHTCGNFLQDPCHQYSDAPHFVDYSLKENLLALAKNKNVRFLIPGCNDYSYISCAWVAEQIGLSGYDSYETTLTILHKDRFRSLAQRQGYPVPKAAMSIEEAKGLVYPILVKPVDSFSGRGIQKLYSARELPNAFEEGRKFSVSNNVVVEEYKEGGLYSHSAFISNGRVSIDFFVDEYCTVYPYQVNSSCLSVRLNYALKARVRECIEQLISDLGLVDGLLHTQFIANDDEFWLIELTRRCPGDLYSKLIFDTTGINYADFYVRGFLQQSLPEEIKYKYNKFIARHTVSTTDGGVFVSLKHDICNASTHSVQLKKAGEIMRPAPFDKAAILFSEFDSEQRMAGMTEQLKNFVSLDIVCRDRKF